VRQSGDGIQLWLQEGYLGKIGTVFWSVSKQTFFWKEPQVSQTALKQGLRLISRTLTASF
jgi:hypothetical protein